MNDVNSFLYVHGPDLLESIPVLLVFIPLYMLVNYAAIKSYRHFTREQ